MPHKPCRVETPPFTQAKATIHISGPFCVIGIMPELSKLTYKIAGYPRIESLNSDEFVDWANEMIELGHESDSLYILAGIQKPTNFYESSQYVESAFSELGLELKSGDDAVLSYSYVLIDELSNGIETKKNLNALQRFCVAMDYMKSIYPFYLLHFELENIELGIVSGCYWSTATPTNIQQTIKKVAKEWLDENKENYTQQQ